MQVDTPAVGGHEPHSAAAISSSTCSRYSTLEQQLATEMKATRRKCEILQKELEKEALLREEQRRVADEAKEQQRRQVRSRALRLGPVARSACQLLRPAVGCCRGV